MLAGVDAAHSGHAGAKASLENVLHFELLSATVRGIVKRVEVAL
jgi:hypothetical protein